MNGDRTRCAEAVARVLARAGITPTVTGTVADNDALLALVAAGHGATIVPELVLARGRAGVTVADQPLRAHRTIWAVTRRANAAAFRPLVAALARPRRRRAVRPPAVAGTAAACCRRGRPAWPPSRPTAPARAGA